MRQLLERAPQEVVLRAVEERAGRPVDLQEAPVGADEAHADRRVGEAGAEERQGVLAVALGGDLRRAVHEVHQHEALLSRQAGGPQADVQDAPVGAHDATVLPVLRARERGRAPVVGVQEAARVAAHQLVGGDAHELGQPAVGPRDPAVPHEQHADRGRVEGLLEARHRLPLGRLARAPLREVGDGADAVDDPAVGVADDGRLDLDREDGAVEPDVVGLEPHAALAGERLARRVQIGHGGRGEHLVERPAREVVRGPAVHRGERGVRLGDPLRRRVDHDDAVRGGLEAHLPAAQRLRAPGLGAAVGGDLARGRHAADDPLAPAHGLERRLVDVRPVVRRALDRERLAQQGAGVERPEVGPRLRRQHVGRPAADEPVRVVAVALHRTAVHRADPHLLVEEQDRELLDRAQPGRHELLGGDDEVIGAVHGAVVPSGSRRARSDGMPLVHRTPERRTETLDGCRRPTTGAAGAGRTRSCGARTRRSRGGACRSSAPAGPCPRPAAGGRT